MGRDGCPGKLTRPIKFGNAEGVVSHETDDTSQRIII